MNLGQIVPQNKLDIKYAALYKLSEAGVKFALPHGRTKGMLDERWSENPHGLEAAISHAKRGGNVGIVTGAHSNGICAFDIDVGFPEALELLGEYTDTWKIIRDNAPDRGKLLYRMSGELPKTQAWSSTDDGKPEREFLADGRHAICEPSEFQGGRYLLIDTHIPLMEITPDEGNKIWVTLTGNRMKVKRLSRKGGDNSDVGNPLAVTVKEHWTPEMVFSYFGLDSIGTKRASKGNTRLLGNGGLFIKDEVWNCFSANEGGDAIDAWHYCKHGTSLDRSDKLGFIELVKEMANVAGITLPQTNGHLPAHMSGSGPSINPDTGEVGGFTPSVFDELRAEFDTLDKSNPTAIKSWALDVVDRAATLDGIELGKLKLQIEQVKGLARWADKELVPLVRQKQKELKHRGQKSSQWEMYEQALTNLGYAFRMNELDDSIECNGAVIADGVEGQILMKMLDEGFANQTWVRTAISATAYKNRYNPVHEFLNKLVWDGKDWIAELGKYIKDSHQPIVYADGVRRSVFEAWLRRWGVAAVGKALHDRSINVQNYVLVFTGKQDGGKSTLAKYLCPIDTTKFHLEDDIDPEHNDHKRWLASKLVWEVGELGSTTRKADRDSLKRFLTMQEVTFRIPYARYSVTKPTLTSFIGTVNPDIGFLRDSTGHRRFLPVDIKIDFAYAKHIDFNQLWAQFVHLYKNGEPFRITDEEKAIADSLREEHEVEDPFEGYILKHFEVDPSKAENSNNMAWATEAVDVVSVLAENGVKNASTTGVGLSLRAMNLRRERVFYKGRKRTFWFGIRPLDGGNSSADCSIADVM